MHGSGGQLSGEGWPSRTRRDVLGLRSDVKNDAFIFDLGIWRIISRRRSVRQVNSRLVDLDLL